MPRSSSAASISASMATRSASSRLHVALAALLQRVARVLAAGALGEVVGLLVAPAGDVVLEEPARRRPARRSPRRSGRPRGPASPSAGSSRIIWPSLLALPSREQVLALDLLVVLELGLEEAGHLHGGAGRARDAHPERSSDLKIFSMRRRPPGSPRSPGGRPPSRCRRDSGARGRWFRGARRAVAVRRRARAPGSRSGDVRRRSSAKLVVRVVAERLLPAIGPACQQSPLGLPRFLSRSPAVGESVEELAHVGFGASERLQHEDLLERAFLEVEDHRVPGRGDDLVGSTSAGTSRGSRRGCPWADRRSPWSPRPR